MKKLLIFLAVIGMAGCQIGDCSEKGCWEISLHKEVYGPDSGLMIQSADSVFVNCAITENAVRNIISEWGGVPNETVKRRGEDGREIYITTSYKPWSYYLLLSE